MITRYDYNLTIMESPKPATDNRFKKLIKSYLWNWTMLNFCGIVVAILKMETGRNFSMSGINSGHYNLSTYEMALKSDNVEFVRYCGSYFEYGDQ
jgi:putative Mn2+ efflux pump MntP